MIYYIMVPSEISGEIIRESGFLCTPRITGMESTHGGDETNLFKILYTLQLI